ncbi:MAG: hypothetical protein JSW39_01055, partial [Desulfobacterales bacterium]
SYQFSRMKNIPAARVIRLEPRRPTNKLLYGYETDKNNPTPETFSIQDLPPLPGNLRPEGCNYLK